MEKDLLTELKEIEKLNNDRRLLVTKTDVEIEHTLAEIDYKRKEIESQGYKADEVHTHITNEEIDVKEQLIEIKEKLA